MLADNYLRIQTRVFRALGIDLESSRSYITAPILFYFRMVASFLYIYPLINNAITEMSVVNVANAMSFTFSVMSGASKIFIFLYYHKNIMDLIKEIRVFRNKETDVRKLEILNEESKREQFISSTYTLSVILTSLLAVLIPLVVMIILVYKNSFIYMLPFKGSFPYDLQNFKNYLFSLVWTLIYIYNSAGYSIALDTLFCGISYNLCAIFKVLAFELRTASSPRNRYKFVELHQWALKLADDFGRIYRNILFAQFMTCVLIVCANGFLITSNRDSMELLFFGVFFVVVLTQLFVYGYCGQRLQDESTDIGQAVFESALCDPQYYKETRHIAILMIIRSQRACILDGYFFAINLETCTTVLRAAMSYIALLRSLEE